MRKTQENLNLLTIVFIVTLVISNVITGKVINLGISLFGNPITIAGAIICYPVTYLITDIVGEIWGKKEANRIVRYGFLSQIIATLIIILTTYTPAVDPAMQEAYVALLGQNWVFVVGSLAAYLVSQFLDVTIFHTIRSRYIERHGSTKGGKWIWNNLSTMTSQLVDTAIFITIAFGLGFGWLWSAPGMLVNMLIGQYLVKFACALIDTPFFYFFTRDRA